MKRINIIILFLMLITNESFSMSLENHIFQTFDEYNMIGHGDVTDTPFVSLCADKSNMFVSELWNNQTISHYYQNKNDYWVEVRFVNCDSNTIRKTIPLSKTNAKTPRLVTRYLVKDTIFEFCENYIDGVLTFVELYVKTETGCLLFKFDNISVPNDLDYFRDIVCEYINNKNLTHFGIIQVINFKKIYYDDMIVFRGEDENNIITYRYRLNSLGEFGLSPGLYADNNEYYQYATKKNSIYDEGAILFEYCDIPPQYIKGKTNLENDIKSAIKSSGYQNISRTSCIVMGLKINRRGYVEKVKIKRTVNPQNHLINIAESIAFTLNFVPAKFDGDDVDSWITIPFIFETRR